MNALREHLHREARAWRINARLAEALFVLPVLGAAVIVLARTDPRVFRFLTAEDSLLEWLQFAGYAAGCMLGLLISRSLASAGRRRPAAAYAFFALACFVVGGEEIAWGQRLLGLETPPTLESVNLQRELTAHNISTVQTVSNVLMLLVGLYGSAGAWIVRRRAGKRPALDLFLPPVFLTSAFFVLFGYKLLRFMLVQEPRYTVVVFGEWPEFCLAAGVALFALLTWRRLRVEPQPALSPRPA